MGEFELIQRYFNRPLVAEAGGAVGWPGTADTSGISLGVGDDCALISPAAGMHLAVSSDMLVCGRHFFADADPRLLGHKALAVNLSDLAACGAKPLAFTLALALPHADDAWLAPFSEGLWALADAHGCHLVGGDTTQGPLNLCITVWGEVPPGQALLRSGAQAGDDIFVSGNLGEARLALEARRHNLALPPDLLARACQRMDAPTPRVALGLALRGIASAAADVSDGLMGDLGHILKRSGVGATVYTGLAETLLPAPYYSSLQPDALPGERTHARPEAPPGELPSALPDVLPYVLAGGDDYELVFTVPPALRAAAHAAARASDTPITRIGQIEATPGLRLVDAHGNAVANRFASFDHFKGGESASKAPLADR
ncbi:thiamine-phosphate kinase [Rhodoferax sp.]|uniref:thiamine-phosphate kinase n=1 Tax=Rhodoferax sp. TaxID=50421 RepID=UPI003785198F